MNLFDPKGHLTPEALRAHAAGSLDDGQTMRVLEHVCVCRVCADRLWADFAQTPLLEPPRGFTEAVTVRVERAAEDKKADYRRYCLRVALSTAAALTIVVASVFALPGRVAAKEPPQPQKIEFPEPQKAVLPEPVKDTTLSEKLVGFWEQITNLFKTEE